MQRTRNCATNWPTPNIRARGTYRKDEEIKRFQTTNNKLADDLANLKYAVSISFVFRELDAIIFCEFYILGEKHK